jgi:chloramphenicol-sensitive protein RarD
MTAPPPDTGRLDPARAGAAALSGYLIWGLSPLFYMLLDFTSATEIVLHRAVWSAPVLLGLLLAARRWPQTLAVLADRKALLVLLLTAVLIGANWWAFIFAVNSGRVLEVSLGYFINPLMNVAVGVLVLGERFGRLRALAVGLAALGVLNQLIFVGAPPYLALFLAVSFTAYAYVRKTISVDGRIGLFWETVLIAIPSLPALIFLEYGGGGHFFDGWRQALLLVLTGPMTVAPLLLFILGARGLSLAVIGLAQFLAPTLQFAVGLATGETFSPAHAITFGFIWAGLAVFVFDLLRYEQKRKTAGSPA